MSRRWLIGAGRTALYGSLGAGLAWAVSLHRADPASSEPFQHEPDSRWLELQGHLDRLELRCIRHLVDRHQSISQDAALELMGMPNQVRRRLVEWAALTPEERVTQLPGVLAPDWDSALYQELQIAALHLAPAISSTQLSLWVRRHPMPRNHAFRTRLLGELAGRAEIAGEPREAVELYAQAARSSAAGPKEIDVLVAKALEYRQAHAAIAVLEDWLDDPPTTATSERIRRNRFSLAQLSVTVNDRERAWVLIEAAVEAVGSTLPPPWVDLAWWMASNEGDWRRFIPIAEAHLRAWSHHHVHWRELKDLPDPGAGYVVGMSRLATALEQARQSRRAVEVRLHLACLDNPIHLVEAFPLAAACHRLRECQLVLEEHLDALPAIAKALIADEDRRTAEALLAWRVHHEPSDLEAQSLLLDLRTRDLPAFQAAMLWRRHLENHPDHPDALDRLVQLWEDQGQLHAALKELTLAADDALRPHHRIQAARWAIQLRDNRAFATALPRLMASHDPVSLEDCRRIQLHAAGLEDPGLLQLWTTHALSVHPDGDILRRPL